MYKKEIWLQLQSLEFSNAFSRVKNEMSTGCFSVKYVHIALMHYNG